MKTFVLLCFILLFFPANAATISAKITGTVKEVAVIQKVLPAIQQIINSHDFKERIYKSTFTYTDLKNEEIYKVLTEVDWTMDLVFEKQGRWSPFKKSGCKSNVLGWTYPNVKTIWINRCNFDGRSLSGIAGTLAHEYSHKLGFTHPFNATKTRPQSVPYSIGTIISELYGTVGKR